QLHRAVGSIDGPGLAEEAVARAARARDPIELAPGSFDVILEPQAVAELLEWLAFTSFGARSVEDGSSCLSGRAGQRITGPITIVDEAGPGDEGAPWQPFEAEGTSAKRLMLIARGIAGTAAHDRASAARANTTPTGHAGPVADELSAEVGPIPMHLQLAGP